MADITTLSSDQKRDINNLIKQILDILPELEAGRDAIKTLKKDIREIVDIDTKVLNQVIAIRYRQNRDEIEERQKQVDAVLNTLDK